VVAYPSCSSRTLSKENSFPLPPAPKRNEYPKLINVPEGIEDWSVEEYPGNI
jgi:hypothetical protein